MHEKETDLQFEKSYQRYKKEMQKGRKMLLLHLFFFNLLVSTSSYGMMNEN